MTVRNDHDILVLRTDEDLREGPACDALERMLDDAIREQRRVLLAFGPGTRLSAHALGIVARASREAERHGSALAVSTPDPDHRWLLGITGLSNVLQLHPSESSAISALVPEAAA